MKSQRKQFLFLKERKNKKVLLFGKNIKREN